MKKMRKRKLGTSRRLRKMSSIPSFSESDDLRDSDDLTDSETKEEDVKPSGATKKRCNPSVESGYLTDSETKKRRIPPVVSDDPDYISESGDLSESDDSPKDGSEVQPSDGDGMFQEINIDEWVCSECREKYCKSKYFREQAEDITEAERTADMGRTDCLSCRKDMRGELKSYEKTDDDDEEIDINLFVCCECREKYCKSKYFREQAEDITEAERTADMWRTDCLSCRKDMGD